MRPAPAPLSAHDDELESIAQTERCFTERPVWRTVGTGWQHLHGSVQSSGVSFEWHDFKPRAEFDWGRSFHPHSVEVCLNLSGTGQVAFNGSSAAFAPLTAGFYRRGDSPLHATRRAEERHQFLTVELSFDFVRCRLGDFAPSLHPLVRDSVAGKGLVFELHSATMASGGHVACCNEG